MARSMIARQNIKLNLVPGGVPPVLNVSQYDSAYDVHFTIYNGAQLFEIPDDVSIQFQETKRDGNGFTVGATKSAQTGQCYIWMQEQMSAVPGDQICELVLTNTTEDQIGTANFIMRVEPAALTKNTVISESEIAYANQVLAQLGSVAAYKAQLDAQGNEIDQLNTNLAAEVAARQAADNTLQSNINSEASTRATADAALQSQINQLVAPEGAAPSAAEITNARVGADGTVYQTLGDAIRGQVTDVKTAIDYTDANALYRVNATWEEGAVNGSTGAEEVNANFSRTSEYISTTDADFVSTGGAGFTLILFDLENGSYVRKASKYVNTAASPWAIDKRYGYFRLSGGIKIANHPENSFLIYKYTKTQIDLDDFKTHFVGMYAAKLYMSDGNLISWEQYASVTILTIPHDTSVIFEGFPEPTNVIPTNNIFAIASTSDKVTVSGDEIRGNNFAILYDIKTKTISIVVASSYKPTDDAVRVLFSVNFNSNISGMLVDYVIRKTYESTQARLESVEYKVSHGSILPSYWYTYLETKIADVQSKDIEIGNHGDSFVFVTDLHYVTNDGNSAGATKYVLDHSSVTKVIIGGDICNGDTTSKQGCINQILACRNDFRAINPYYLRGNHDNNTEIASPTPEKALSDSELYGLILKPIENKIIGDRTFHYYFDNEVEKVRYICLDTGHPDTNVISDAQITWMQERITELSAGWTVVVLTHQYYSTVGTMDGNGTKILAGLNAIYDTASATIAGVICGHSHADYMETTAKGFPIICTTCDVRAGQSSSVPLTRTAGTYTEQAFDVFHIDTTARMIYATRIGAGSDRSTAY